MAGVGNVQVASSPTGSFTCSIRWSTGATDILTLTPDMTIHAVKETLAKKHGKPVHEIVLHYAGRPLECPKTVRSYDVANESQLRAVHREGPQTAWHGTQGLYAQSSDGLKIASTMEDVCMICACTPRPAPGDLVLRGIAPWTFHWDVSQAQYCPDEKSFSQRNVELFEWKGENGPHVPVPTAFKLVGSEAKVSFASVILTPLQPLVAGTRYLLRINGGAISDGIKILGQTGIFPAGLTAVFSYGAAPLPAPPVAVAPPHRAMCDGLVHGYYREELTGNPNLVRDGDRCVFCGHAGGLHPRQPVTAAVAHP